MLGERVDIGGRHIHYVAAGNGSPMVVFESGGGGGSSIQDMPVMRSVSAFTRACTYDRAGLGWSDPAPPGRSFEERASDLHELLHRVEKPPFVLVGLSFGGLLARVFCQLYPDDVAGLVLVDGGDEEKYLSTMPSMRAFHEQQMREEAARAQTGELRTRIERQLRGASMFTEAEKDALLEVVPRAGHYMTSLEELSVIDRSPEIVTRAFGPLGDLPLIVLTHGLAYTGEMAPWEEGTLASHERLMALSQNGAGAIAAGVGHSIALEHPALVVAAIKAVVAAARGAQLDATEVRRLAENKSG